MSLNFFYINLYPVLIELFLGLIVCFCLIFGASYSNSNFFHFPLAAKCIRFFVLQGLFLSFILLLNSVPFYFSFWNKLLLCDSFAFYGKFLIFFFSISWMLIWQTNLKILNFEFWILILLSIIALNLLIQANDLLSIYLFIEFLSLTFYILTSINRNSEFSTESGLKYFILGAFASSLLLFGFTLIYNFTGLTNLPDLLIFFTGYSPNYFLTLDKGLFLAIICVLTAILFKLGAAPFHLWVPDVYEGAPTIITSFFAILPKITILILLIRFVFNSFGDFMYYEIYLYLIMSTFLSSLIGTAGAFLQSKWKRFVAFSSISHLSFFLLNLCVLNTTNLVNLVIYLIIYLIMSSQFFSFFSFFKKFQFPKIISPRFFNSLTFLNITNPLLAICFTLSLFSFAGIPPLAGFFSKFFVFYSAISSQFFFLSISLLGLNCISCFYYINLIKKNYFNDLSTSYLSVMYAPAQNTNLWILSSFSFLILFLDFDFVLLFSNLMCSTFLN
uniref:NADH dehydrogenase subunit 2 n=1 Tax=Melanothamnus gigas TaxID=3016206 RepID=A0A9F1U5D3_9FLOR|nr:NADH dehydrogenase subunit 2 [Melanothamnus gigas]WAX04170.1 NADH dehydrogenase subunit 2 [Melanothamnus gigas]